MRAILFCVAATSLAVDFNREIRPILSDNCFQCHGPDEKSRMASVRLDTKEGLTAAASRLYQRITHEKRAMRMPPATSGRSLTDAQIALIKRWIDEGAKPETHWSFVPPKRPEPPAVKEARWVRNPIDRFILARLEKEGLRPSPEADRATLIRRVTFDLTGLPPTAAEVDGFLADKSPRAYEEVVDRLLASPRYGERMAMHWLDLARYADTHGYHIDSHRDMWPWRDWVIRAFNRNMPFDQFTIEQLAGDLLRGATMEQQIATGFNRNHMINFEGGAIPEEYQNEYVADRVETTATVWLGLTMGCARCHDHKYDPLPQKDFYRFYAFFNNVPERGLDGRAGNAAPVLRLGTPEERRKLEDLEEEICAKGAELRGLNPEAAQREWERRAGAGWPASPRQGLVAHYEFDGNLSDSSGNYRHGRTVRGEAGFGEAPTFRGASFNGETTADLGDIAWLEKDKPFSIALWYRSGGIKEMVVLQQAASAKDRRGFEIYVGDSQPLGELTRGAHIAVSMVNAWPDDAIRVRTRERQVMNRWLHLAINYDGSGQASGLTLHVNGKAAPLEVLADGLRGYFAAAGRWRTGDKDTAPPLKGQLDDLRFYNRQLTGDEIEQLAIRYPAETILLIDAAKRSREQRERLEEHFLTYEAPEPVRNLYAELKDLKQQRARLEKSIPTTMVMEEMAKPRQTVLLARGDYRNRGETLAPAVPAVLPPLSKELPSSRLGVARWLVDPSHPLTARVTVNRFWQMYFGHGIVKTAEDFGSQGEAPVHPELLDWLATEFVRSGWNVKEMQKLILMSAAYRQSSRVTPALVERDPENRLLARGPRFRLPAETIRDNALAASGLLHEKVGGPSVYPYQPEGVWEEIAFGDVYSAQVYSRSRGEDLYRRSMYTFWKRTLPPPSLATFDAPDREKCTARRPVTNTPLQALVLMNDPTYVEAARVLAEKMIREAGKSPSARIRFAFRRVTARAPSQQELRILLSAADRQVKRYRSDPEAARNLLAVGESRPDPALDAAELAAWTNVASIILNLDETITKE